MQSAGQIGGMLKWCCSNNGREAPLCTFILLMRLTRTIAAPVQQPHVMFYARQAEKKCTLVIMPSSLLPFLQRATHAITTRSNNIYIFVAYYEKRGVGRKSNEHGAFSLHSSNINVFC